MHNHFTIGLYYIGNPEKIKENNINLMGIPELKKFQSHQKILFFHRGLMNINCNGLIQLRTFGLRYKFVCVTEQHYVSIFFTHKWSVRKPMLFWYIGRLVTSQQSVIFILSLLNFWLQFGFVFICMRS